MQTFITTLVTSGGETFDDLKYNQLDIGSQAIHLVRQCFGMKYLKFVYGEDLWFIYKLYHQELECRLSMFEKKAKQTYLLRDQAIVDRVTKAIMICNNALFDPAISLPITLSADDLNIFYIDADKDIPMFGSLEFAKTFFTHIDNNFGNLNNPTTSLPYGSILAPYNPLSSFSAWREVQGSGYKYDATAHKKYASKTMIEVEGISSFFKLLMSIEKAPYLEAMPCLLSLLASFMIDPDYLSDYVGYISAMTGITNARSNGQFPSTNSIIYKGCYRVLFSDIEDTVFVALNNQCKSVYVEDKRRGFGSPNTDPITAKNFIWLILYITNISDNFFSDSELLNKLITYFEPSIVPAEVPALLSILHNLPEITIEEENTLLKSGFGRLFKSLKGAKEADEEDPEDDEGENPPVNASEKEDPEATDEGDPNAEPENDDSDDMNIADDDEFGSDDFSSDDGSDDFDSNTGGDPATDAPEDLPEYLFKLGAPPELDSTLYRLELDRKITGILKDPPAKISGKILKLMRNLQAYWLHLINMDTLKRIINIINQGVKK